MQVLPDLADDWRNLADQQRDLGAEAQARTLEWCADQLEERLRQSVPDLGVPTSFANSATDHWALIREPALRGAAKSLWQGGDQ